MGNAAADMSRMDRETATLDETAKRVQYTKSLRKIFLEFDEDGSGTLTWDEFQRHMDDSDVQAYLSALEINVSKARALFKLLDTDESGCVSLDEFVMGCLRLKGGAKTLDVGTLMYETRSLKHLMHRDRSHVINNMKKMSSCLKSVQEGMADLQNRVPQSRSRGDARVARV